MNKIRSGSFCMWVEHDRKFQEENRWCLAEVTSCFLTCDDRSTWFLPPSRWSTQQWFISDWRNAPLNFSLYLHRAACFAARMLLAAPGLEVLLEWDRFKMFPAVVSLTEVMFTWAKELLKGHVGWNFTAELYWPKICFSTSLSSLDWISFCETITVGLCHLSHIWSTRIWLL